MKQFVENAHISSTQLGGFDGGAVPPLLASLFLEGAAWGQGTGTWHPADQFVTGVCNALKVDAWEKLKGTPCRILRGEARGDIKAIGHFIEDRWYVLGSGTLSVREEEIT